MSRPTHLIVERVRDRFDDAAQRGLTEKKQRTARAKVEAGAREVVAQVMAGLSAEDARITRSALLRELHAKGAEDRKHATLAKPVSQADALFPTLKAKGRGR